MKETKEMTDEEIVREGLVNSIKHKTQKEFTEFRDDYISKLEGKISALRIEEKKMLADPSMADHKKMHGIENDIIYQSPLAFFYLAVWENFFLDKDNYEDLPIKTLEWIEKHDDFIGRLYEDYYLEVQEASFLLTERIMDMVNGYYYKDNIEDFEDDEEEDPNSTLWQDPDYLAFCNKEAVEAFNESSKEPDCSKCPDAGKCDGNYRAFCEANTKEGALADEI